jgi:nucleoside-diphosphate-sugar epimerase
MRVLVTGTTGSAVIPEPLGEGHETTGLARPGTSAEPDDNNGETS